MTDTTPQIEEPVETRQPWQPLEFEKIAVADARAGFIGTGSDFGLYS